MGRTRYNQLSGTSRVIAAYPEDAPIPPSGSVYMYRSLNDQQLYTVTPGGVHQAIGGGGYILPPATAGTLGGVKTGANVTIAPDGTISVGAPGITDVPANALFVDSFTGNDGTATKRSLVNKYSRISTAVAAASPGEVIIVFPGSYPVDASIWKNGVSFYFYPGAEVSSSTGAIPTVIQGVAGETCKIFGQGTFLHSGPEGSNCIYKPASGCTFHMEAFEMTCTNGVPIEINTDTQTYINSDNIIGIANAAVLIGSAGGTPVTNRTEIVASIIETRGLSAPAIAQTGAFNGSVLINVGEVLGTSNATPGVGANIVTLSNSGTGEITIKGDIRSRHTAGGAATAAAVRVANSTIPAVRNIFRIIGNITAEYEIGLQVTSQRDRTDATEIFIDGNITCTNNRIFDSFTAPVGGIIGTGSLIHLNGVHRSGIPVVGAIKQTEKMVLYLTGRLEAVDIGIDKTTTTTPGLCKSIFQSYVIFMSGGAPVSIFGGSGGDTYTVNTVLSSNVPTGGAPIANGVPGSLDIVSPAVE